jgi:DNA polymerase III alpha subunit
MVKYVNISVPVEVKKYLQLMKGNRTWGEFLLECNEHQQLNKKIKPT